MNDQPFSTELNEEQREAVYYNDGPLLVIAGAGSGKTRVLTYKIAYLLEQGVEPWHILALTFTNKAAREMQGRIAEQVGINSASRLWMGTFHSIFSRILRTEAELLGFTPHFTIYDQADSRSLVKSVVKDMMLDDKTYKPAVVASHISNAKNHLVLPSAYMASAEARKADEEARIPMTGEIYRRYMLRCRQADAMDFDDLLLYTYILFKEHPEICRKYAERFEFVLVDEYQDTNFAQHQIVWLLTKEKQRVCVVGDDAQSIYSFRGAKIDNILNFTKQYTNAKIVKLEQNYRSTQMIVEAANSLIHHNSRQIHKDVFSRNDKGEPLHLCAAYSDVEEAEIVVNKMSLLHRKQNIPYENIAVLYRTNAQSRTFEEAMRKHGIPYRIYGGLSFYQRKEVKDVIAYFRLIVNPNDEEAFKRIVNYPARGIGDTTVGKISNAAMTDGVSLWEVACHPEEHGLNLQKGTRNKLQTFIDLIAQFTERASKEDAATLALEIVQKSGIINDIYQDHTPENLSRQENVQELINGVRQFVDLRQEEGNEMFLSNFLQEVSLLSDQDEDDSDSESKVTLMTVHAAKGLEFDLVFIVGMEDNLFPNQMVGGSTAALEEERRLFYVAVTRARKYCYLSFARSRFRFGKMEFGNPSRFLNDIAPEYIVMEQKEMGIGRSSSFTERESYSRPVSFRQSANDFESSGRPVKPVTRISGLKPLQKKTVQPENAENQVRKPASSVVTTHTADGRTVSNGMMIEHERFGIGKIVNLEGSGENTKATVEFQNIGTKQLLLRFARFRIIEN